MKMSVYKARVKVFENILKQDVVNIEQLQDSSFHGVPDEKGLRSLVWKILLNYLPLEKNLWESLLQQKRQLYQQFIEEVLVYPDGSPNDHPLNLDPDSLWGAYFEDNKVLLQIDRDVRRLWPDMSFFHSTTDYPCMEIINSNGIKRLHNRVGQSVIQYSNLESREKYFVKLNKNIHRSDNISDGDCTIKEDCEAHWEVVERILFIYAKLNPGQGYVQGMNEIIGPLYHIFATDPDEETRKHAEADCFFCFTNLMAEIRDRFIRVLDDTENGINHKMRTLSECLKKNDYAVWDRLQKQELLPEFYSFRWLTLLLSQEFPPPDIERIWDSLFAHPQRLNFLIYICCAMIILLRDKLLMNDFASNVKLLQHFPPMDVSLIIKKAVEISLK